MRLRDKEPSGLGADMYPDNPVLLRRWRGQSVESQHRGAWVLVDSAGDVVDGAGAFRRPVFARSSTKSIQALPLIESGAASAFGLGPVELALACSSHNAEDCHTQPVTQLLGRLGLDSGHLLCGATAPGDPNVRRQLFASGESPSALHHNCSGKHAAFLALAAHLGDAPASYLDPASAGQAAVRGAMVDMCDLLDGDWETAIDGCSAPTFRLPLHKLALGLARVANPDDLTAARREACNSLTAAVAAHPELVAGNHKRLCTALSRVTGGRLFPKVGAEAIYVIGVRGADRGLALKVDDGNLVAMNRIVLGLLEKLKLVSRNELDELRNWTDDTLHNDAGLEIGRTELGLS
ncbi:MAG: asparaginase [Planctomycetota bacterium]|nr:asparaginase [Planctomycetota bacterium]